MDASTAPLPAGARATATRWTVALLALATALLALALAASAAYILMFVRALGAEVGPLDLLPVAGEVLALLLPAVVVGWVVGVVAARLLAPQLPVWPWLTGLASALLGCGACVVVLVLVGLV